MVYRWLRDQVYTIHDLSGLYRGGPIFILGGSPLLNQLPLDRLAASNLPTLALNNVPYVYPRPTMWLTADKPSCFGGHFFARPDILKFAYMNHKDEQVAATGKLLKEHPTTLLYRAAEPKDEQDFFSEEMPFVWWKSVFPISLQLCWRLGVRKVYLVGCAFHNRGGPSYAWDVGLTQAQADYSQLTYDADAVRLLKLKPLFGQHGFEVISCTPHSRANAIFPYVDLEEAINRETAALPRPSQLSELQHSSEHLSPEAYSAGK